LLEQIDQDLLAEIAGPAQDEAQTVLSGEEPSTGEEDDHE
jgi:hypothetical protein